MLDFIVIGGGPAGSTAATLLALVGIQKRRPLTARPIPWQALPDAASV